MKEWKKPQLIELGTNMTETYGCGGYGSNPPCNPPTNPPCTPDS